MKGLIFTYALTYGGAFVSIFNPFYGLLVYICFSIIRPENIWFYAVPPGNYSRIVAVALLIGWVFRGFGDWNFGKARPIVFAFIGFWLWAALSTAIVATNKAVAIGFLEHQAKILLPFLVGATTIRTVQQLQLLAWTIVGSLGYLAFELNLQYLQDPQYFRSNGFGPMDNNSAAIALVCGFGFAFFLGLMSEKWWAKGIALGIAAMLAHAVMFSFSRGGMLSLLITSIASFVLIPKKNYYYILFALAIIFGVRLAGPEVIERFSTTFASSEDRDASADSRIELWKDCLDVFSKNPILGIGPDHWPLVAQSYGWPGRKEAHSLWVQLLAELGLPGVLLLLGFYLLTIFRLWPLTYDSLVLDDPWLHTSSRMVISSLLGFMVAAQFVSLDQLELPYYVALVGACSLTIRPSSQSFQSPGFLSTMELSFPPDCQEEHVQETGSIARV